MYLIIIVIEQNDLNKQTENYKLSLRKKKLSEFISNKRHLKKREENKNKSIYDININEINLPESKKKKTYLNSDNFLIEMLNYLKSNNPEEILFGVISLRNYFSPNEKLNSCYNLNIITDIIDCMDKNINNNSIIYNGIWILINYCYLRDDNLLNHLLITPKCFRIYEKIILSNDMNLFYQIIWLFYNITVKDDETSYDIISSSLFKDNIIKLLDKDIFLINVNEDNIYNSIIIEAIHFLYNLIRANKKIDDCVYELEISNMKLEIIKVLIKFLVINDEKSYGKILKAIVKFSDICQSSYSTKILTVSFVENLIDKKKMFSNIEIIILINSIIGNFVAVNDDNLIKNNEKTIDKILNLEYYILSNYNETRVKIDCFWALSNIAISDQLFTEKIIKNKKIIELTIKFLGEDNEKLEMKEILIFILNLLSGIEINSFIFLGEIGVFEKLFEILLKFPGEETIISYVFKNFFVFLNNGELIREHTNNKNIVLEQFNIKGGKEYLLKYQNSEKESLKRIVNAILDTFYQENDYINIEMDN